MNLSDVITLGICLILSSPAIYFCYLVLNWRKILERDHIKKLEEIKKHTLVMHVLEHPDSIFTPLVKRSDLEGKP